MNNLRLILLGIGILIIAGIYIWGIVKSRRHIRSRVERSLPNDKNDIASIKIKPNDDLEDDFSVALAELENVSEPSHIEDSENPEELIEESESIDIPHTTKSTKNITDEPLLALYIMADQNKTFKGPDILKAVESVNMIYGPMKIFHHYGNGEVRSKEALFSLLNVVEPGYFDFNQIENFSTNGLALFMRLPAVDDGEMVFNKMLDTAWQLAKILGGELHDADHNFLEPARVNSMREKASLS